MKGLFETEFKLLKENQKLANIVEKWLIMQGLDKNIKGFSYCKDIITLSLLKKQFSKTTIAEITPFIAYKNGIKDYSVQRQMRYVCTIKTNGKYIPDEICRRGWYEIKNAIEKKKGNGNDW